MLFTETSDLDIGSLQPKILRTDKKTIYSCGIYSSKLKRFFDIGKDKSDNGEFNYSKYIFGVCSAAALYKQRMLKELKERTGYFDERFFFLFEDVDLSWRAQRAGWKALYYPEAVCYHSGNNSNTSKKIRQYLCFRNRYYAIIKNEGFKGLTKNIPLIFIYDFSHIFYLFFTNPRALKGLKESLRFLIYEQ